MKQLNQILDSRTTSALTSFSRMPAFSQLAQLSIDNPSPQAVMFLERVDCYIIARTVFEDTDNLFSSIPTDVSVNYALNKNPIIKVLALIQEVIDDGVPVTSSMPPETLQMAKEDIPHEAMGKAQVSSCCVIPPSVKSLTERQKEILEAIVNGKSYKLIAQELYISPDTVRFHIKNIYELLQVHSKYELITKYKKLA